MKDIKQFAVQPTGRLHLRDANDNLMFADEEEKMPVVVVLYGPGSKEYARAVADQANRMLDNFKRKGKAEGTAEQRIEEKAQYLAACTKGFENMKYDDLEGHALAMAVYSDTKIGFIADQVAAHLGEWGNFSTASSRTSAST